ncbi:hypothetical protein SAMN04487970_101219 [Paenibacillus tianmuensis]|uniref:Uncharacterized protein n=1 Tax=Paenibacillus tianmuensis TaxID=624147 RepID=A0A1G4R5M1_9BACL|nr:hypothetical protein SAMN04487970_101219 [Paenibacillus tianmuensis]
MERIAMTTGDENVIHLEIHEIMRQLGLNPLDWQKFSSSPITLDQISQPAAEENEDTR